MFNWKYSSYVWEARPALDTWCQIHFLSLDLLSLFSLIILTLFFFLFFLADDNLKFWYSTLYHSFLVAAPTIGYHASKFLLTLGHEVLFSYVFLKIFQILIYDLKPFFERVSFLHWVLFTLLSKSNSHTCVVYFWTIHCVPLIYLSIFSPIPAWPIVIGL